MQDGIKAVRLNTVYYPRLEESLNYQIFAVGYETSGDEFLLSFEIQYGTSYKQSAVKFPIHSGSIVLPQGVHLGLNYQETFHIVVAHD